MPKPSDVRVRDARIEIEHLSFRTPLKFGGRIVENYQVVNIRLNVETRDGRRGTGMGSMPIGHIWAWPTTIDPEFTQQAMRQLTEDLTSRVMSNNDYLHPLDHGVRLVESLSDRADHVTQQLELKESMPRLAALVASSAVDAAIYDAFGHALGLNVYHTLGPDFVDRDLSTYLSKDFEGEFLDRYTLREPKATMPLYHLVGALDPLTPADVAKPIGDGLPETLGEWITFNGLTHLKIKLAGDQLDWDVDRVISVEKVAFQSQQARGCRQWYYSLDFNEKCQSMEYVQAFLDRVQEQSPFALQRVQYIEQPTHRDLKRHGIPVHAVAAIKPVVIDESLVDFESLLRARELGYSGVALKACKGETESLLMAAAAQKFGMFLCVQDLTCPGASFLHSGGIAARIPGIAALEGNGRQYCPTGNKAWVDRFPTMFQIKDGNVGTGCLTLPGLGHTTVS
ncbi:hypothetical protein K2X85_06775 [bacterium]|nr:hypothetical protein [bacterium]